MFSPFDYFEKEFPRSGDLGKLEETNLNSALYKIRKDGENFITLIKYDISSLRLLSEGIVSIFKVPTDKSSTEHYPKQMNLINTFILTKTCRGAL